MTPEELAAIEARSNAATEGPWKQHLVDELLVTSDRADIACAFPPGGSLLDAVQMEANATFIAHARTDIPDLLAAYRAKEAECARMREALVQIAEERKQYRGMYVESVPVLSPEEVLSVARAALEAKP